jgi:hypothetical protein
MHIGSADGASFKCWRSTSIAHYAQPLKLAAVQVCVTHTQQRLTSAPNKARQMLPSPKSLPDKHTVAEHKQHNHQTTFSKHPTQLHRSSTDSATLDTRDPCLPYNPFVMFLHLHIGLDRKIPTSTSRRRGAQVWLHHHVQPENEFARMTGSRAVPKHSVFSTIHQRAALARLHHPARPAL